MIATPRGCGLLVAIVLASSATVRAADEAPPEPATATVSYFQDVRPIFQAHCQGCHQPAKPLGEFVMTSFDALVKGGESTLPAIVPGKPDESYLIEQITPADGEAAMPKDKDPLTEDQIKKIRQWIADGAKNDTPASVGQVVDAAHPPKYEAAPVLTALAFSPDGSLLAVSGYHETLLYQGDGSALVARLVGESERIESLAFSPDGKLLAVAGGSPGRLGEVQVWDVATHKLKLSVPVTHDTVYGVSWSGDGKTVAFGCADNTLRAIDAVSGKQVLYQGAHSDWVLDTVFSKDSTYVISVSRDRSMKLVEVATQRFVDNITSITPGALKGGLAAVDRHPQKDELLIGGADGVPKVYQMLRTKDRKIGDDYNLIKAYEGAPGASTTWTLTPTAAALSWPAVPTERAKFACTKPAMRNCCASSKANTARSDCACFNAAGNVVASAGFDGVVRLNDVETGKLIKEFSPVPEGAIEVAAAGN